MNVTSLPIHTAAQKQLATSSIKTIALALSVSTLINADVAAGNREPETPTIIAAPVETKVAFHTHAAGVQIYIATPSTTNPSTFVWTFSAPEAVLFDNDGNAVGLHYAGPTWESASGSKVVGARVSGITVDTTAVPWLLLKATSAEGPGIFARTTYIQRVNTVGGLAPAAAPTQAGQVARVPYTAEYFFYRASQH
jgi:hypothetical protein